MENIDMLIGSLVAQHAVLKAVLQSTPTAQAAVNMLDPEYLDGLLLSRPISDGARAAAVSELKRLQQPPRR